MDHIIRLRWIPRFFVIGFAVKDHENHTKGECCEFSSEFGIPENSPLLWFTLGEIQWFGISWAADPFCQGLCGSPKLWNHVSKGWRLLVWRNKTDEKFEVKISFLVETTRSENLKNHWISSSFYPFAWEVFRLKVWTQNFWRWQLCW